MQILHIVSSLNPAAGGVSQAILTIIKGLEEKGIINEVATIDTPDAAYLQEMKFPVHAKGPGKTAWQYAPALLNWLKENLSRYDAVIVHGLWQYQTYATYKAWKNIKGKKPKLFAMPHGMLDPYFQRAKGRKMKAIRNWIFWKWNEHKLVNNSNAILFTCETEKILAREPFTPYRPKKEAVVSLGVESPPIFNEQMRMAFEEKLGTSLQKYWLFISRIHEKKGVDLLVQAYLQLKNSTPTIPPLVIAGPGLDTPFGATIQQMAVGDNQIYFPGMLAGNAKWGAFYGSEVFILPSHQENFGIAVVEALACGKPALISNQVNIWREIIEGNAGLATNDTETDTYKMLENWYLLPSDDKEKIVANTKATFTNYFTVDKAADNMIQLFNTNN